MHRFLHQDTIGGALLFAIGLFVAAYAQRWQMGTLATIGPALFPTCLGLVLAMIGALIFFKRRTDDQQLLKLNLKPFFCVLAALVIFAIALRPLGLVVATILTVIVASLASNDMAWRQRLLLAPVVAVLTVAIFKYGLGMVLPVWWFD